MTHRDERGSAALEAVVGLPAFAFFVALIIFGGRTATAHQALESAAADAARSASLARSAPAASEAARQAAEASLANQDLSCTEVDVIVDVEGFAQAVGRDASVDVAVECRLDLSDLSIPGVPGSRLLRASMSSPLDNWRERSS